MIDAAHTLLAAGFSVIPTGANKKASIPWAQYQQQRMTADEAKQHFTNGARLAIIGGKVSGNLECLDFDDPTTYHPFLDLLEMRCPGLPDKLLKRQTPSGGYHLIYRCSTPVAGNLKLAMMPGVDDDGKPKEDVRIETRAEGGYFLSAPSEGYRVLSGSMTKCPTLIAEEVDVIHTTAKAFDLRKSTKGGTTPRTSENSNSPGSQFNQAHQVADILEAKGWKVDRRTTLGTGWTRPGKDKDTSGVLLDDSGNFYVFSANAYPLEPGQSYSAFAIYAAYNHGGDYSAAARDLARQGFAEQPRAVSNETKSKIKPLPATLDPVAQFDYDLLPEALRDWCRDVAERMQAPPDFVAVGLLVAAGATLGRKIGIRPQQHTPWTEVANQWGLIVARPGKLKTPSLDDAMGPLNRLIASATDRFQQKLRQYEREKEAEELRQQARKKAAKDRLKENPDADISDLQGQEMESPTLRRYKTNDPTPAALGELLRVNPNGLMVFRDELVSLFRQLDKEDNAEGRGFYLTGWGGNSPYTFDRIGRGLNLHLEAVCISVLGGTQPGKLAGYIQEAVKGGAGDDGLLQRFGLLVWPDDHHKWQNIDRPVNMVAKNAAYAAFEHLDKLNPAEVGAKQDKDFSGDPEGIPYLRFDTEALALFTEWRTDLENKKLCGDDHPAIVSHLAKYRKLVPSLALIFHIMDGGSGAVTLPAVLRALAWAEYLETHARRAYGAVTKPEVGAAKSILKKLKSGTLAGSFTARDIYRAGWTGLGDRQTVVDALELLVDHGYLGEQVESTGGRPTSAYNWQGVG
ncbi:DUF3987 domain-containing protein [Desulfurivibrio dismutans]|uniref:DUF3987 domain-containing protein n=1 Tax=Desulfurivibrio dismutans TaxID=1398908 RepID=UPI0023DB817A|nr:DUF3987 domain-containing protein [Desulfurivibrio alkaliphilus]MDF1613839.1 DUF3987 domain-containing protein [Desulfurivibrio alkaliphilus]